MEESKLTLHPDGLHYSREVGLEHEVLTKMIFGFKDEATAKRVCKKVEILSYPGENFRFMAEWYKQLYGESEGKDHLGIYPSSCELTADLHSLGQYIQDGERMLFETIFRFEKESLEVEVPFDEANGDGLNYVAGKKYSEVFKAAAAGVKQAHITGGVPVLEITADSVNEESLGEMIAFFEAACGISGYMQGVNPFDQPGVEEYKKNMFALLGKK